MLQVWFVNWAMIAGGVAMLGAGARAWRRFREARRVPFGRIGEPGLGVAEVHGKVRGAATLVAPLAGRPCVLWRCRFRGPFDAWSGRPAFDESLGEGDEIALADQTGEAVVHAAGAELRGTHRLAVSALAAHAGDAIDLLVRFRAEIGRSLPAPKAVEVSWIEPGDDVWVLGTIERRVDPQGDLAGGYRGLPVRVHMDAGPWGPPIVSAVGGRRLRRSLGLEATAKLGAGAALIVAGIGTFLGGFLLP